MKIETKINRIINSDKSGAWKYMKLDDLVLNNEGGCLLVLIVKPYLDVYRKDFEEFLKTVDWLRI